MAKLIQRLGTQSVKFQFGLEVHALQMSVRVGAERRMSVMWTRGPRICATPAVENCRKKELPARYEWGKKHPLLLLCTLYKDKNGKFLHKISKIVIKQHKEGEKNAKTLGSCKLDLAENVNMDVSEFSKDLVLSLEKCADVDAELHITIHSKPITAIKMDHKEGERLSHMGSFSEGDRPDEIVEALDDTPEKKDDDEDTSTAGDKEKDKEKDKDGKDKSRRGGEVHDDSKRKMKSPRVHADTSGFSSLDATVQSNKTLIEGLQEKLEGLGGQRLKDSTESGEKLEDVIKRQDKLIERLQEKITDLSRNKAASQMQVKVEGVEKDPPGMKRIPESEYLKKEKEFAQLQLEVKDLRVQLDKARSANDILVQKNLADEKKEFDVGQLQLEIEKLKKKRVAFKKIKAVTDREKGLEQRAAFFEDQLKDAESTLHQSNAHWKGVYEKQAEELRQVKDHLEEAEKQLEEVLKIKEREKTGTAMTTPVKSMGDVIPKDTYLGVLAELAKVREDRLKLSQYMSKLEVEYVQVKVELVNTVDRCNTLEQQNHSLKELIKKLDTDKTLADFIEQG